MEVGGLPRQAHHLAQRLLGDPQGGVRRRPRHQGEAPRQPFARRQGGEVAHQFQQVAELEVEQRGHGLPEARGVAGDARQGAVADLEDQGVLGGDGGDQARAAAEAGGLAQGRAGPDLPDQHLAVAGRLAEQLEPALQHHQDARLVVAFGLHPLAGLKRQDPAMGEEGLGQVSAALRQPFGAGEDLGGQGAVVGGHRSECNGGYSSAKAVTARSRKPRRMGWTSWRSSGWPAAA